MSKSTCLQSSLAFLLGISDSDVEKTLGYPLNEMKWPEYPPPFCFRSMTIHEAVFVAFKHGYALTEIIDTMSTHPFSQNGNLAIVSLSGFEEYIMSMYDCILLGKSRRGVQHAVAWLCTEARIHDPRGSGVVERESLYALIPIGVPSR